jgi:hypothetical protein
VADRLQRIDQLLLPDHFYLGIDDECYFYGEYTVKGGFAHSDTNRLILNFKKEMNRSGNPDWKYKAEAITEIANIFTSLNDWPQLQNFTWVPIPPSKDKNDPNHDDRLLQTLQKMKVRFQNLDFRELVRIIRSRQPAHGNENRPTPENHYSNFEIDQTLTTPAPTSIVIFDDVITTGSGFKAMKRLLSNNFPGVKVIGVFVARARRDADQQQP